jgi:ABC-2 type transport system ATP-binding protein
VINYRSAQISAEDVLKSVRDAGITIRDVRTQQSDLEDDFWR